MLSYATPAPLRTGGPAPESAWREGNTLVVRKGVILPHRCVRCNGPAEGRFTKHTVYWHRPGLYLLLLAGLLPYAVVMTALQERGTLGVHLCARHRLRRLARIVIASTLMVTGVALTVAMGVAAPPQFTVIGMLTLLCGTVLAAGSRLLTPRKIDAHFIWLRDLPADFLAPFPPLPRGGP